VVDAERARGEHGAAEHEPACNGTAEDDGAVVGEAGAARSRSAEDLWVRAASDLVVA